MSKPSVAGIIPARYASTRLPGKPLKPILGKPMIQHVYERCAASAALDHLYVATDDERIRDAVEGFGGKAVMTRADHESGTDRLAVARSVREERVFRVLLKPSSGEEVAAAIDEALAQRDREREPGSGEERSEAELVRGFEEALDRLWLASQPIVSSLCMAEAGS